jgi:para-aminobenzoate synthetase / 4-amino-4-deoxychorismate lyase
MTTRAAIVDSDSQSSSSPPTRSPFLRFDFADTLGLPGPVCFSQPERVIVAHDISQVGPALRAIEEGTRQGLYAAGYVAYEAAPAFDDALVTQTQTQKQAGGAEQPLVWFGLFRGPHSPPPPAAPPPTAPPSAPPPSAPTPAAAAAADASAATSWMWQPDITPAEYRAGIDAVKEAIARGDTYQVNYTFRLRAAIDDGVDSDRSAQSSAQPSAQAAESPREAGSGALDLDPRYLQLANAQRAPYSAYLNLGRWCVLSLSPELFFKIRGGRITTKPMKGTAPRGRWREEDEERAAWLAASEKNRAENVMIVDLARNDVGRIAEVGSVRASSLFEVERYPSVFQLVSTVEGTLRERTTLADVFGALFPAGSITGAPKSSSMRLIASIEHAPRGVYCGAIGFVAPNGDAIFNVAIRTAAIDTHTRRTEFGVGGGVTWDSTTDAEYAEALSKAACLSPLPAFDLLETMRLEDGVIVRRERHVERMRESAGYFDVPFDAGRIDAALDALRASLHGKGAHRLRLLLSPSGVPRIQTTPLALSLPDERTRPPSPVVLAKTPVSSQDIFLFHKTTNRAVYEAHTRAIDRPAFDVLLWNEAREVTEFTIGNVIAEIDGERYTPPRRCGLLGGTLRAELLEQGAIRERIITLDALSSATRLWLINSVRGAIEVRLA